MSSIIKPKSRLLQNYIEYFWTLSADKRDEQHCSLLPPEARFELVLSFAAATEWKSPDGKIYPLNKSFVCGMRKGPFYMNSAGSVEYLSIRFYPHGLSKFMNIPIEKITNAQVLDLENLECAIWKSITEKIGNCNHITTRIEQLETELLKILEKNKTPRSWLLEKTLTDIHSRFGSVQFKELYSKYGSYPKQLEREFNRYIGLPPKLYSRIVRFHSILDLLNKPAEQVNWLDIAYQSGYFDQSHFIKEFTHFSGMTPENYYALTHLSAQSI